MDRSDRRRSAARPTPGRDSSPLRRAAPPLPHARPRGRRRAGLRLAGRRPRRAERAIVAVAAWTHDVVYDANPGEDERASARWAREALDGVAEPHIERVEGLILTTIEHDAPPDDRLATALLDADLAILGAPEERYAAYAEAVREEYAKYPDDVWREGRIAVLEGMLSRTLYRSEAARTRWATAAEKNLAAELTHWRRERTDHR